MTDLRDFRWTASGGKLPEDADSVFYILIPFYGVIKMSGQGAFFTNCRGEHCHGKIRMYRMWSGKYVPVEPEPIITKGGETVIVNGQWIRGAAPNIKGFVSHHFTCPDAKNFHKPPERKGEK